MKYIPILGLAALMLGTGCKKSDLQTDKLSLHQRAAAYMGVNDPIQTRSVNAGTLDPSGATFDTHQTWFDFTTIDANAKGKASLREGWHLGFYSVSGSSAEKVLSRVVLNYSSATNGRLIAGAPTIAAAFANTVEMNKSYDSLNGGPLGNGVLSTFDFHRDNQFVIGTPTTSNKVYLIKTPPVQIHPDTSAAVIIAPAVTTVEYWLVSVKWNSASSTYDIIYNGVKKSGNTWVWEGNTFSENISKSSSYQYLFVKFATSGVVAIQPPITDWNFGLSAVTLKRYMTTGTAYAFGLKGVVLNNNPKVQLYKVQSTPETAGAPGPFDPNFSGYGSSDPALDINNSIESRFINYNADSIKNTFGSATQEEIGQYWRYLDAGRYRFFVDRFYVIKIGNDVYKLKFDNLDAPYFNNGSNDVNGGIKYRFSKIATTP